MRAEAWILSVGLLALTACSSGGGAKPKATVGVLDAGNPVGIQYSTATQSGVTDTDGRFRYVPGESVTFRVAGVMLGKVPGAARISVFTLAGMSPPTTELQLRRELVKVGITNTKFSRAMNIAALLLSLDADNDPGTGIDLRNRGDSLSTASLDLDALIAEFHSSLKAAAPGLNNNLPFTTSVSMLYRWTGIAVPGHQPVGANNVDGQLPAVRFRGTYDTHGRLALNEVDHTGDGNFDDTHRYSYDSFGRGTLIHTERDFDSDRILDFARKLSSRFDARGSLVGADDVTDSDGDGIDNTRSRSDSTFDALGQPLERVNTYDFDANGVSDARQVTTFLYDAAGNLEREVIEGDFDLDGVVDGRFTTAYTYLSGLVATRTHERDSQVDGVEFRRRQIYGYDPQGRLIHLEDSTDDQADGVIDLRQLRQQEYDLQGNVIRRVTESEYGSSGVGEDRVESRLAYDPSRRLLSEIEEYSSVGEVVDAVLTRSYSYDANGFPARLDEKFDGHSQPGSSRDVTTFEHNAGGAQVRSRRESDDDADGDVDRVSTREIEYEPVANAVLQIASQYLP